MILCICTFSVTDDKNINEKLDLRLRRTAIKYDTILILSEGMKNRLNINHSDINVLPLGADIISDENKDYSKFKLLYVGTLTNRDIDKTLLGLKMYLDKYPKVKIEYHIVGDGNTPNELASLKKLSKELELDNYVYFYGRIPNVALKPFFDKCNYGVSFVPKTK
jgi:glycosyltransferase involved in cell wall biosynthesis